MELNKRITVILYIVILIILSLVSFLPAFTYWESQYDSAGFTTTPKKTTLPGIYITLIPMIFYFIAFILLCCDNHLVASFVLSIIGNVALGIGLVVIGTIERNVIYVVKFEFEIGFYLICTLWVILILLNIYIIILRKILEGVPVVDQIKTQNQSLRYCPNCNAEIKYETKFCVRCGKTLK